MSLTPTIVIPTIGIVSKPEHARAMVKALTKAGGEPVILGGDKSVTFPDALRIVVLRSGSCAHAASEAAAAWWREDKTQRLLVWNNSAKQAVVELGRAGILSTSNEYVAKLMGVTRPEDMPSPPRIYRSLNHRLDGLVAVVANGVTEKAEILTTPPFQDISEGRAAEILSAAIKLGRLVRTSPMGKAGVYGLPPVEPLLEVEEEEEEEEDALTYGADTLSDADQQLFDNLPPAPVETPQPPKPPAPSEPLEELRTAMEMLRSMLRQYGVERAVVTAWKGSTLSHVPAPVSEELTITIETSKGKAT